MNRGAAPADGLELSPLQLLAARAGAAGSLLLPPVLADLVDRLVQAAHALQQHQRPGPEGLAGSPQPADDPDLRQRTRHQTLLAQRGPAGLLQRAVEQDRRRQGHAGEELRRAGVAHARGRVHPVEPGGGTRERPHQYPRAEGRVTVAGLAHREHGAEHRRAVEAERDEVLPAAGEAEVLLAEADQAVEGEGGGDRRTAEQQDVGGGAVDGLLAPAALLAALPASRRPRAFSPARLPRASTATAASTPRSSTAPGSNQSSDMSVSLIRGPLHRVGRNARHSGPIPSALRGFRGKRPPTGVRGAHREGRELCSNCPS